MVASAPGRPARKAMRRTRRSCESFRRRLEAIALQPPVERAARQADGLGGPADVAVESAERLLDDEALDVLQADVVEELLPLPAGADTAVLSRHLLPITHQHRPLH